MKNSPSLAVDIDGKRYTLAETDWNQFDCIQVSEDAYHLIENGKTHVINVIASDPAHKKFTFKIDGEIKEAIVLNGLDLLIEKMGLNTAQSKRLQTLNAPMPGLVTGLKVTEGQEVEKGTTLVILEAMKMENVIVAPHDTVIKQINVSVGQAVEKGAVLMEFSK
jgi:acetyl/propionyl-CoA carboxylase alpha subunit